MIPRETLNLVRLVANLCPAMRVEEHTAEAWHLVIGDLEAEDCVAAVRMVAARKPFIAPSDIVEQVKTIRSRRLDEANHVFEPRPDEDPRQQIDRLAAERRTAASNVLPFRPRLALPAPAEPVQLPPTIAKLVGDVRAARNHPALAITCPWEACRAQAGRWCEKHTGSGHLGKRPVTGFLHPSRIDAATPAAS